MLALYMRLSVADTSRARSAAVEGECEGACNGGQPSDSIASQRLLLREFVHRHPQLADAGVREFVDDGCTGTTFDRPAFRQLLAACHRGQVQCVVVKDYSRLGRTYLEAGDLIGRVFPQMGVRFIALAEGYDSAMAVRSDADFVLGLKNIVNAAYSQGVSIRTRAGVRSLWRRGIHVQASAPFGFAYDRAAQGRLRVEREAAQVVRLAYDLAATGLTTGQVARQLNLRGIAPPAVWLAAAAGVAAVPEAGTAQPQWNAGKVRHLLRNREYAGTLVGGKTRAAEVGSKRRVRQPADEQVVVTRAHGAVVDDETFALVNALLPRHAGAWRQGRSRTAAVDWRRGVGSWLDDLGDRCQEKLAGNASDAGTACEGQRFAFAPSLMPATCEDAADIPPRGLAARIAAYESYVSGELSLGDFRAGAGG